MAAYLTGRVWELRDGATEADLLAVLDRGVAAHYERLHPAVRLGLLRLDGRRYLATQRWPDRAAFEQATTGTAYEAWLEEYRAVLSRWEELATFVEEWQGEELR